LYFIIPCHEGACKEAMAAGVRTQFILCGAVRATGDCWRKGVNVELRNEKDAFKFKDKTAI